MHKIEDTLKKNIHFVHLFLANKIDKMKTLNTVHKSQGGNVTQL